MPLHSLFPTSAVATTLLLIVAGLFLTCSCSETNPPTTMAPDQRENAPATSPASPESPTTQPASAPASRPAEFPITVRKTSPVTEPFAVEGLTRVDYISGADGTPDWALVLPDTERTWIVCIHGHGSTGDQLYTRPDIRRKWLPAFRQYHFGIVTPNLRGHAWMSPAAVADLHSLLDYLRQQYRAERFILASASMGGASNLIYAALYPEDVAGVIALCPASDLASYYHWCRRQPQIAALQEIADAIASAYGCDPEHCPDLYRDHSALANVDRLKMPVFVTHGARDTIIPISQSQRLLQAIEYKGVFRYCVIPEGDHDAPLREMPDALEWVLKRMR